MATPDKTPGERNVQREGPEITAGEARDIARGNEAPRTAADRDVTARPVRADEGVVGGSSAARGASGGAGNAYINEPSPDQAPFANSETALGGADNVEKTTYGVGRGADTHGSPELAPVGLRKGEGTVAARTNPGRGANPIAWIVAIVAGLIAVVYALGIFGS